MVVRLAPDQLRRVEQIVAACTAADRVSPLSEQTLLHARYGEDADGSSPHSVLVWAPAPHEAAAGDAASEVLVGFAHWDPGAPAQSPGAPPPPPPPVEAELVVAPSARGEVWGEIPPRPEREAQDAFGIHVIRTLIDGLHEIMPRGADADTWVHGDHAWLANALSRALTGRQRDGQFSPKADLQPVRTLWQLRRSLAGPDVDLDAVTVPGPDDVLPFPAARSTRAEDLHVRNFRVGVDGPAWLDLNARAFAGHPEQGRWSAEDLAARMREEWFDPAGFFVAERVDPTSGTARMVGFHWTKIHFSQPAQPAEPATGAANGGLGPIGEVYVLGVDPDEQGSGLGRALARVGLAHLRRRGLSTAMLYVEADNDPAVRLYIALGFTRHDTDRMYRLASPPLDP